MILERIYFTGHGSGTLAACNKAVRDKIPTIIRGSGRDCSVIKLTDSEFLLKLDEKLAEELREYVESGSIEELVDILEVVYRISELRGTTHEQLDELRRKKYHDRGGFKENLFLVDADDEPS